MNDNNGLPSFEDFLNEENSSDSLLGNDQVDPQSGLEAETQDQENSNLPSLSDFKAATAGTDSGIGGTRGDLLEHNINPEKFGEHTPLRVGADNFKLRAQAQPWTEQALHSIYQAGVGEIIGGTVEGAGALVDLVNGDMFRESQEYNNALMELGESIREHTQEAAPIYRTNPDKAFDLWDSGWWYSQFPSVVSTVSMMVPAMGVTGAMRMGSKGLRALSKTNKVAKALNMSKKATRMKEAVVGGVASRYVENFREAKGTYDQVYSKAAMQFSDDKELHDFLGSKEGQEFSKNLDGFETPAEIKDKAAQYVAADAAALTFRADWANVGFDILQFGSLLKPFKGTRNVGKLSSKVRQAQDKLLSSPKLPTNKYRKFLDKAQNVGKGFMEAGSEGVEEAINYISSMEGARRGDLLLGEKDDRSFGDRLGQYLQEGELWNSALWGALGGGIFQGIGYQKNKKERNKIVQNKIAEIDNRANMFAGLSAKKKQADAAGNRQGFQETEDKEIYDLGLRALQAGNMDLLIEQLSDEKIDDVIAEEMGISDKGEIKNKKREIITKLEELENNYSKRVNQLFNNKHADLTDEQSHALASKIVGMEFGLKSTERILSDIDTEIAEMEGRESLDYPTQYSRERLDARRNSQVTNGKLQGLIEQREIKKGLMDLYKESENVDEKEVELLQEELDNLEASIGIAEAMADVSAKLEETYDAESKSALTKEEYEAENKWLDLEQNRDLTDLKIKRTKYKNLRNQYKDTINAYDENIRDSKKLGDDPITAALTRTEKQISDSKKRHIDNVINDHVHSLDELDQVKEMFNTEEGDVSDYLEKRFAEKNKELVSKGYTRTVRERQMEMEFEQEANEKVIEDSDDIVFDLSETSEYTEEEIAEMEAAAEATESAKEEAREDTPKDDINSDPIEEEPVPNSLEDVLRRGQEATAEFQEEVKSLMDSAIKAVTGMSYKTAKEYLNNVLNMSEEGSAGQVATQNVLDQLEDKKSELAKTVAANDAGTTPKEAEHDANMADINENDNGGKTEPNPKTSPKKDPSSAEEKGATVPTSRVHVFESTQGQVLRLKRDSKYIEFTDAQGNNLPALGGRNKVVPKDSLTAEQVQLLESADPTVASLHHFPDLGYKTASGTPVLSKTTTPYTENGKEMVVVWDPGSKPYKDTINFSFVNSGKLSVGDTVTIEKDQYGKISIYHKDSTKPIAVIHAKSQHGKLLGTLIPANKKVSVDVAGFSESTLINLKTEDGSSAKLPFGKHGSNGNASSVILGYTDAVGMGASIRWENSEKHTEPTEDPDRTEGSSAGTIYMRKVKPNGKVVPVRMQTANISDEAARKIVDMLKNADQNTRQNMEFFIGMSKNTDFGFEPSNLNTAFAATKEMLRIPIGGQVIGISYQRNSSGFNNFEQALNGQPFIYRVYDSTGASKAVSSKDTGLTISETEVIEAFKSKKFNIDKASINTPGKVTNPLSNKEYNSYNEMLDAEGLLTTDVPASQPFKGTNVRISLSQVDADASRVQQDEAKKGTESEAQSTNDVEPSSPESNSKKSSTSTRTKEAQEIEERRQAKLKAFEKTIESEYEEGDYQKVLSLAYRQVNAGTRGIKAVDPSNKEDLQLLSNYPKLFEEAIKALDAKQKTLDAFDKEKVLAGKENPVPVYEIEASINTSTGRLDIKWVTKGTENATSKVALETGNYTFDQLVNYKDQINSEYDAELANLNTSQTDKGSDVEGLEDAGEDIEMFKLKNGKISGEVLSEREVKWFTDTFGEAALERYAEQKYILTKHGAQAYGAYSNGIATIGVGAIAGTVYHEAFHLVTDLNLTNKEKDLLFRAAEKKYGKKSAKELEEDMALDFEKYMLTRNKKGIVPAILRLFDSIVAHIEKFLGRENEIKSYYSRIRKGEYKGSNSASEMKKFTMEESYKEKPGYSIDEKMEVADMLDFIFIDEVEKGMANGDIQMTIEDLLGISVDSKSKKERAQIISDYMEKTRERLQKVADKFADKPVGRNLANILDKKAWEPVTDPETGDIVEEGWRDIFAARLKAHGIDVRYKAGAVVSDANNTAEDDLQEGSRDMEKHIHGQEAALRDTKVGMSKMLKIKMSMIPKTDAKGRPVMGKKFGQRTFEDFNVIYSDAQTKLVGTPENLIEDKLAEIAINDSNMNALYEEYKAWSPQVQAAFKSQMAAQQKKYFTAVIEKDGAIKIIETNRQGIERQLVEEWKERRHVAPIFSGDQINLKVAAEVESKFMKLSGLAKDNNIEGYMDAAQDILSQFGIELSSADRNYLLNKTRDPQTGELNEGNLVKIATLMRGNKGSFVQMFVGPKESAKKGVKHGVNPYETENTSFFNNLAKELKNVRTDIFGGAFINGEGKQVFSINYNTFLSKKLSKIHNDVEFQKMLGMFYKDVFYAPGNGQKDFLLNMLEDNNIRKWFDIRSLDTLKDKDQSADGIGYDSLTPGNSYLLRLAAYNNGNQEQYGLFNTGTKSDKGESIYARLPRLNHKAGKDVWLISDQQTTPETVRKNAIEIMKKTAYQEIARIKQVQQELNNPNFTEDQYIENVHTKGKKSGKINGLHFMHIPTLNKYLIGEDGLLLNDDEITADLLEAGINEYIQADIDATIDDMFNKGLVSYKNGVLTSEKLPKDLTLGLTDVAGILEEFVMNDLVWRNEMQKFQYGDLAAYKSELVTNPDGSFYLDVTTDASKRGYQMVTPGMDHVTKSTEGGYGKSKTYTMAIIKDIKKDNTNAYPTSIAQAIDPSLTKTKVESFLKNGATGSETALQLRALNIAANYSSGINKTDAQGYQTLDSYKETLEGRGEWSDLHEEGYKHWKKGELGTAAHQALLLQPLKTFSYGPREITRKDSAGREYTKVIHEQVKHSTVPLLPALTKLFPELDQLRQRMEGVGEYSKFKNDKIDVINFDSAVKVGAYGVGTFDNLDGLVSRTMLSENERTPLTIPTKKGADPKDGSQFAKLILANIKPTDSYSLGNTTISGKELITLYNDLYYEKIKNSANALASKIGWDKFQEDRTNPEYQKKFLMSLKEEIVSQLRERDMPESYEEVLTLIKVAEKVDFKLPMNFPLFSRKFEIVLASMFKSKVLTQTFPGTSLVQVAEFGRSDELKWMNPTKDGLQPAEAAIPFKVAEKYGITKYVKPDGRIDLEAYNNDVKNTEVDKNLLNFIAYRIPTQGKNSMAMFKIVKVLPPNSGSSIVLPGEITTQMGADFDVDKLFIQFPTAGKVTEGKDGRKHLKKAGLNYANVVGSKDEINPDFSAEILAKDEAKLNNMLFDLRWSVLSSLNHVEEVLNPLDSNTYKQLLSDFSDMGIGASSYNRYFGGTHTDVYLEDVNRDAKVLVGIFSTHSVAHAAAQLVGLKLDPKKKINIGIAGTDTKYSTDLSKTEGHDGQLISTYISENQNASLDNAKDPITGKLNINKFTSNVISLLNRAGYNNVISTHFVNQPAIRELYRMHQLNPKENIKTLAESVAKTFGIEKDYKTARSLSAKGERLDFVEVTDKTLEKGLTENDPQLQAQVLSDFLDYHATGTTLARSNKVLSPDRISDMSSLSAIESYNKNYMDIITGEGGILMSDPLAGNSYKRMRGFYEFAIKGAENMLSEFFPYNEVAFTELKDKIGEAIGANSGILNKEQADIVNNAAMAWIMTKNPVLKSAMTTENYNRLVFNEDNYLAKRLVTIKDKYNLSDNGLLRFLKEDVRFTKEDDGGQVRYSKKLTGFKGISFNNTSKMTSTQKTLIQDRWAELLSPSHAEAIVKKANPGMNEKELQEATAEVVKLAEDLVTYSIISTGFQSGPRSFIDMVPLKYWTNPQMNMRDFLIKENLRVKEDRNYLLGATKQIIQNNSKLVSTVAEKDIESVEGKVLKRVKAEATGAVSQDGGFKEYIKSFSEGEMKLYQKYSEVLDDNGAPISAAYQQIEVLGEAHRMVEYDADNLNLKSSHPDNILDGRDTGVETLLSKKTTEQKAAHNRAVNPNIVTAAERKALDALFVDLTDKNYEIPVDYFKQEWAKFKATDPNVDNFVTEAEEIFKNCKSKK